MKQLKNTRKSLLTTSALAGAIVLSLSPEARADHMLILLDKSGSMTLPSAGGMVRWDVAKQLASDAASAMAPDREYSVWTFNGSTWVEEIAFTDGFTGPQIADAIQNDLGTPTSATPLAGSICAAVDALIAYLPSDFHEKRLELFSDGLENYTPNTNECWGPNSANHAVPDVGSWEWKVFNKVRTGNPNSAALPPIPLIVNADYLFENEGAIFSTFSAFAPIAPSSWKLPISPIVERQPISPLITSLNLESVKISPQIIASPAIELNQTIRFYQRLSRNSGGRYRQFTSASVLPQLGDLTGDRCVNMDDYNAIVAAWGTSVLPGSLLDPNQDGVVNTYDYSTMLQNWGEGC